MSSDPNKRCSRCKTIGQHHTRDCTAESWPPSEVQWCDRCFALGHDAPSCKAKGELIISCTKCGHEGHHQTKQCTLDRNKPEDLEQFIPSLRKKIEDKQGKQKQNASGSKNAAQYGPLSHRGPPGKSAATTSSTVASSSGSGSGSGQNLTPPTLKTTKVAPSPNQKPETQEERWAKSNLHLARARTSTAAKPVAIKGNFFQVAMQRDVGIRRHRIVLDQIMGRDVVSRDARKALIHQLLTQWPPDARIWVTDYYSHIVSIGRLYNDFSDVVGEVLYKPHNRFSSTNTFLGTMNDSIVSEGQLNFTALQNYVNPTAPLNIAYQPDEDFKALNLLSWKRIYDITMQPRGRYKTVGNKFYDTTVNPAGHLKLRNQPPNQPSYVLMNGYFSSVRPGNGSLLLNVNATTTAFYPPVTVQQWINRRLWPQNLQLPTPKLESELRGLKVICDLDPVNNRKVRTITGFSAGTVTQQQFSYNHNPISVYTYMTQHRVIPQGSRLIHNACCVNTGQTAPAGHESWYPADHLIIVPWQPAKVKIDDPTMSADMIRVAMRTPDRNQQLILHNALQPLGILPLAPQQMYHDFGLNVAPTFVHLQSRYLPSPPLQFGNYTHVARHATSQASWDLKPISGDANRAFLTTPQGSTTTLQIIRIINPATNSNPIDNQTATSFGARLRAELARYGIRINQNVNPVFQNAAKDSSRNPQTRRANIKANLDAAHQTLGRPQLVVVLLLDTDATTYSDVKWWADCDRGIPTVYVSPRAVGAITGHGGGLGLLGNLSLKINFKLGHTNHGLPPASLTGLLRGRTMIVGADVTHSGKGGSAQGSPSLAGVVATCDDRAMHYLASARLQPSNTEQIQDLEGMMRERLVAYRANPRAIGNAPPNRWPQHILFYRDGVSESQYGMVRHVELPQIVRACQAEMQVANGETMPAITIVIVGKRHHTQFYRRDPQNPALNLAQNLNSGLVVDTTVVYPKQFNFYIQSHDCGIGTARSAHYVVLENGMNYTADELQTITNNICFMGSRATKGLSVCIPARYADILCDRLRMYMRPVIENHGRVPPLAIPANASLAWYAQLNRVWQVPAPGDPVTARRTNPWHPNLNNVMFYL